MRVMRQRPGLWAPLLIGCSGAAAYLNSLAGAFVFDDLTAIIANPDLEHLWPPWRAGQSSLRVLLFYTLALNRAVGGLDTFSYHLVNIGLHLGAALTLYGLLRRSLALVPGRADRADALALATALLWCLHPLQTQSITYIIQRGECMAGLFYLLALYGTVRGATADKGGIAWYAGAVLAYFCGLGSKEIAATVPVGVLLFDALLLGGFTQALRRRWGLYTAMVAPLAAVALWWLWTAPGNFGLLMGDSPDVGPLQYALSQPGVILYYLRLALWPWPLVIDYGWTPADAWPGVVIPGAVVASLVLAVAWGLVQRRRWALPGALFFLVLAPTSSVAPLRDILVEHRMYLPLAPCILLAVLGLDDGLARRWRGRPAAVLAVLAAVVLGGLTVRRNAEYSDGLTLWTSTARHRPDNPRAFNNVGFYLVQQQRFSEAIEQYRHALDIDPDYAEAHANLGSALASLGRTDEAISSYRDALDIKGESAETRLNLGLALAKQGRLDEAIEQYRHALRLNPDYAEGHANLGVALIALGQSNEAQDHFHEAIRLNPDLPEAHNNLGSILVGQGRLQDALPYYKRAIASRPAYLDAHINLGIALFWLKKPIEAEAKFREALGLAPNSPKARFYLGEALSAQGRFAEAVPAYRRAIGRVPRYPDALYGLGAALLQQGLAQEGIKALRQALEIRPGFEKADRLLRQTLAAQSEAVER